MSKPKFIDLGGPQGLSEEDRITVIGNRAMLGEKIGVLVDGADYDPDKVERYIKKVTDKFPNVEATFVGPYFKDKSVMAITFEKKRN